MGGRGGGAYRISPWNVRFRNPETIRENQAICVNLRNDSRESGHLSVDAPIFETEYDRAKVPPYNGNDPPPGPGGLKRSLFPTLLNEVQNKGTQGVRARYGAELPPIISIVRYGRPVILGMEIWKKGKDPHPQGKIRHLDFTKDPWPLYYKTPPCAFYHKLVRSKAVFGP